MYIVRFAAVGIGNSLVDAGLYVVLHTAGLPVIAANFISTSCGMAISFVLNSRYTFRTDNAARRLPAFLAVNCAGLWLLQPLVIWSVTTLDGHHGWLHSLIPKLCAIAAGLVWNYLWYAGWVFRPAAPASRPQRLQ